MLRARFLAPLKARVFGMTPFKLTPSCHAELVHLPHTTVLTGWAQPAMIYSLNWRSHGRSRSGQAGDAPFRVAVARFGYLHRRWRAGKERADSRCKRARHLLLCGLGDCGWIDH